jgi:hypothetical protein
MSSQLKLRNVLERTVNRAPRAFRTGSPWGCCRALKQMTEQASIAKAEKRSEERS